MAKYIKTHGAKGDIHTAPLLTKNGSKTKFDMCSDLSQEELEFLYENGHTNCIIKVEESVVKDQKVEEQKAEEQIVEEKTKKAKKEPTVSQEDSANL